MITLYVKSNCPYSARALGAFDAYKVPFELKNIADGAYERELMEIGGKHKVPFMIDGDVHLYESEEIVKYIELHYGEGNEDAKAKLRVHKASTDVCES